MPRGDGTGPNGQGPMTGRGFGYCAGYERPGYADPGRRRRRFFWREPENNGRTRQLEERQDEMSEQLDEILKRLKGLNEK